MVSNAVPTRDGVASVRDGVDALLNAELTALDEAALMELVKAVEVQVRRLAAVDARVLAEVDQRGVATQAGQASTAGLVRTLVHCTPAVAKARVSAARDWCARRGLSGEPLPAIFPEVGAAVADGSISPAHARVITGLIESLPGEVDSAFGQELVRCLLAHAPGYDPHQLRRAGERLKARLDPDGPEPNDGVQRARREFTIHPRAAGGADVSGRLTAAAAAVWESILDTLAAPQPAADGTPDRRSAAQRRHDAVLDAGLRLLRSGSLPDCGGVPATVLATLQASDLLAHPDLVTPDAAQSEPAESEPAESEPAEPGHAGHEQAAAGEPDFAGTARVMHSTVTGSVRDHPGIRFGAGRPGPCDALGGNRYRIGCRPLRRGDRGRHRGGDSVSGYATTGHGGLISIRELLALAAEAEIIPVVLADTGGVLGYGRSRRLASVGQRLALAARDGGCSFPQCTRPASWCQVHHVRPWQDGGSTDVDQMTLLCGFHHREFERRGWSCTMIDGVPYWIPPAFLDPDQRPIRNSAHHLELGFDIDPNLLDAAHRELEHARAPARQETDNAVVSDSDPGDGAARPVDALARAPDT